MAAHVLIDITRETSAEMFDLVPVISTIHFMQL